MRDRSEGRRHRQRIVPGQIWVTRSSTTRTRSRRVLEVAGSRICYSSGGDRPRWCQARAFRLWIRRYAAVTTRTRRCRSLTLRQQGGVRP